MLYQSTNGYSSRMPRSCAGYLQIRESVEKSKQELHRPTHLYPSIKMFLKNHFQNNTPFTDRPIQLDLISRSSIDTIHVVRQILMQNVCVNSNKSHRNNGGFPTRRHAATRSIGDESPDHFCPRTRATSPRLAVRRETFRHRNSLGQR